VPYYIGSPVLLTFTLTDKNGQPVQAASSPPVCTVTLPDETTATPAVLFDTGQIQYQAIGPSALGGHYLVSWECTDTTYPGGSTDSYDISPEIENSILSLTDARRALRITDDSEDDFIAEFSRSVTDVVEWHCGPVLQQTVVEELRVGGLNVQLSKPPVLSLTAWTSVPPQFSADTSRTVPTPPSPMFPVMVYGVTYPLSQLYCDPEKGIVNHTSGLPFYYGPFLWQYQAGRVVVPESLRTGAKAILKHIYGLERGGQASQASLAAAGDEETTETPFGFAVPNRALEIMASQIIPAAFA
jgi:hypothetical protein